MDKTHYHFGTVNHVLILPHLKALSFRPENTPNPIWDTFMTKICAEFYLLNSVTPFTKMVSDIHNNIYLHFTSILRRHFVWFENLWYRLLNTIILLQAFQLIFIAHPIILTAILEIIRIIHVLILKITRHQKDFKILAHVNTVSLHFFSNRIFVSTTKKRNYLLNWNVFLNSLGAPVYISNPHFYLADPDLLDAVDGLKPNQSQHETYFKIQPVSSRPRDTHKIIHFFLLYSILHSSIS